MYLCVSRVEAVPEGGEDGLLSGQQKLHNVCARRGRDYDSS